MFKEGTSQHEHTVAHSATSNGAGSEPIDG